MALLNDLAALWGKAKTWWHEKVDACRRFFFSPPKPPPPDICLRTCEQRTIQVDPIDLIELVADYRTKLERHAKGEEKKLQGHFESLFSPFVLKIASSGIDVTPIREKIEGRRIHLIEDVIQQAIQSKMYAGHRSVRKILNGGRWDDDEKTELLQEYAAKIEKEVRLQLAGNFEAALRETFEEIADYVRDSHKCALQAIKKDKGELESLTKDKASKEEGLVKIAAGILEADFVRVEAEAVLR